MRKFTTISIVLSCLISFNFGIPYDEFQINVVKSGGEIGQFETLLRESLTTTKNFFARDDVQKATTSTAAGLSTIIGPMAAVLPMIQSTLSKESDWKEPLIETLASQEKTKLVESQLDEIELDSKEISGAILLLNASLHKNPDKKSKVEQQKDISNVAIIQDKLINTIDQFSSGNSLFREFPDLAVGPLLGLSILVAYFTPIRDAIYQNTSDETIVSCLLSETLVEYLPLVLHWRLKRVESISTEEVWKVPEYVVYAVAYEPETYLPGGGGLYYHYENASDVRCNRNACDSQFHGVCFKDKMQDGDTLYSANVGDASYNCLVDYLLMVKSKVQEIFNVAIELSNSTCSNAMRNRRRQPTGNGWWTFTKLSYWAYGDPKGEQCDNALSPLDQACDVYIKIFINNELDLKTKVIENQFYDAIISNYKTPKISKKSHIRIEMWDDDSGFLATADDLLLNRTYIIEELVKQSKIEIKAGTKNVIDNSIEIEGSAWMDEYSLL